MINQNLSFTEEDFTGQEKSARRKDMAGAFAGWLNSMSINPDQNLPQVLQAAQLRRADKIKGNRTVNMLEKAGRTDLADMVKAGTLDPKQAASQLFAEAGERRAFERQKELADYKFGLEKQLLSAKPTKVSAAENKIQRLMETGLNRATAIAIADGRLTTSQDPITGQVRLIDKGTGNVIAPSVPQSVAAEAEDVDAAPEGQFEGLDPSEALGLGGWTKNVINVVGDAIGAGQAYKEAGEVSSALENLQGRTILLAGLDVAGKPSNFTREEIRDRFTISANELTTGPDRAYQKSQEMVRLLEETYAVTQRNAQGGGGASVQQQKAAMEALPSLEALLRDYKSLQNAFATKINPASSPAVDPVEIDLMNSLLQQDGLR
jgi:hypothetical protein